MIGKAVGAGSGFRGLMNYLMYGQRDALNPDRVAWAETRNLILDDPELAPRLMKATAVQSTRCKKPAYHVVISWRNDENPTDELMRLVGDRTLLDLELSDHQAVLVAHHDTEHKHLHIVVNRVHPETTRAWHASKDWERLEVSLGRQAKEHGLLFVPGRHNMREQRREKTSLRPRNGEYQMAKRKRDPLPASLWSKEEIKSRKLQLVPIFDGARSWDQLARHLRAEGLTLHAKGQGLIIADDTGYMKLSHLGKDIRLQNLEELYAERFADFSERRQLEAAPTAILRELPQPRTAPPVCNRLRPERPHPGRDRKNTEATSENDDANMQPPVLDEQEKERLRLAMRQARGAVPANERRNPNGEESGNADTQRTRPSAQSVTALGKDRMPQTPRQDAQKAYQKALASLDFTRSLLNLGLVSEEQVKSATGEADRAREEVQRHQTFREFVEDSVTAALMPSKTPNKDRPRAEKKKERDLDDKRDKEDDERER